MPHRCCRTYSNSRATTLAELDKVTDLLIDASLEPNSKKVYSRAWKMYADFCNSNHLLCSLPIPVRMLTRFISFLFTKNYAASTVRCMVSALVQFHKMQSLPDPSLSILVQKALHGLDKLRPSKLIRKPITLEMIEKFTQSAHTMFDPYIAKLFSAMIALGFYALLRVGEMTGSKSRDTHCLFLSDVSLERNSVSVTFRDFKHNQGQAAVRTIKACKMQNSCPIYLLRQFLKVRGSIPGPLFIKVNGAPPYREEVLNWLLAVAKHNQIGSVGINTHSLRIGGATHLAKLGWSGERIRIFGRWKSDAYKKYIHSFN